MHIWAENKLPMLPPEEENLREDMNLARPRSIFSKHVLSLIKLSLLSIILIFVSKALYTSFSLVDWSTVIFRPFWLFPGFGLIVASVFAGSYTYQYLYRHIGFDISFSQATALLTIPGLGKYIPGKVLSIAGHTALAHTFGVGVVTSSTAVLLITALSLLSSSFFGLLLVAPSALDNLPDICVYLCVTAILVPVVLTIATPDIYWRFIQYAYTLLKEPPRTTKPPARTIRLVFLGLLIQNGTLVFGISVTAASLVPLPLSVLLILTGASCLAAVAGFLALFAPAGIGVREGLLLMMLATVTDQGAAGLLVVSTRLIQTLIDVALACSGYLVMRNLKRAHFSATNDSSRG